MEDDRKKILIVEDSPGDAFILQEILQRLKPGTYDIETAGRLDEALVLVERQPFDVVLLDMNLPDSRGLETIQAMKEKAPDSAIVVMTGHEDEKTGLDAVKSGAQDFLVKGKIPGFVLIRVIGYALERQLGERRFRESEMFLRSTLDALRSHIAIIDDRGGILAVNKAWKTFAAENGADVERVCEGADYFGVCSGVYGEDAVDVQTFMTGMKSVLSGEEECFQFEYPCHSPSEKRWFFCRITPFPKPGPACVVVAHENITERKLAEEALKNSELKMRTILDSLSIQVVFLRRDHTIDWANKSFCDYAACGRESLGGKKCYEFWGGQESFCTDCSVEQAIKTGTPVARVKKNQDGRVWYVVGCPVRDQGGRIVSMVELREDITERVSTEEQLRHSQKMDAIGRLAGGVAHDFNNMLSIIIGFAEISRNYMGPGHPLEDNLQEILSAARRSAEMTRHLLAFARKQTMTPKVLDFNTTIENSRKMLQRLVGEDIDIRFIPGESLSTVIMDPIQLDQILTNLAVNARDAISGTGRITIETRNVVLDDVFCKTHVYARPGYYVAVSFSDDGCGMDRETQSRIFEPFFTTKPQGEGTGLGLSTVFGIVKQNSGLVDVYSEPGQGTTLRIYLPAFEGVDDETVMDIVDQCPKGTETLLVVEDEKKILKFCKQLLSDLGYRVLSFSAPEKAVRYLERSAWPVDLLISDVVMPEMNGEELRKHVERLRPGVRCLFMSGYTHNVMVQRGVFPETIELMQKPFSIVELANRVRRVLDR